MADARASFGTIAFEITAEIFLPRSQSGIANHEHWRD
jgi:hypothetical protein